MIRHDLLERVMREVYGGQPTDDANITEGLVNTYITDGIGVAAKMHWKENIAIEGIGYVNNSFQTTFKGIAITEDTGYTGYWKFALPQIPFGLGRTDGIKSIKILKDNFLSYPVFILSADQWEYAFYLPQPTGIMAKNEGNIVYLTANPSTIFFRTTATVTMVSGGDATDLSSTLNVPDEWIPTIQQYVVQTLILERKQPQDNTNDGADV